MRLLGCVAVFALCVSPSVLAASSNSFAIRDVRVFDGAGKTLLPGLINAHVHVFPGAQKNALRFGVTTELDMFDVSHDHAKWKAQRERLTRTNEADTWASGIGVTVKGGAPIQSLPPGFDVRRRNPRQTRLPKYLNIA